MTTPRRPRSRPSVGITTTALTVAVGVVLVAVAVVIWWAPWRKTVVVPNATNVYPAQAQDTVQRAGLKALFPLVPAISDADTGINGYAISQQSPAAGSRVRRGSTVTLTLVASANAGGIAPQPAPSVVVPDVTGQDPNAAIGALVILGLRVDIPAAEDLTALTVTRQSVSPGTSVKQGTHIELRL